MTQSVFQTLQARGYVYQATNEAEIRRLLDDTAHPISFYLGIDPTADSLHIGHFCSLMTFRRLQRAGHRGILLIGGATGAIGDPSGRQDIRAMMERERLAHNLAEVKALAARFVEPETVIVNNADWTDKYPYIDFMRDIGKHFNVAKMLATEAYDKRLSEGGLTFMEMGYMLMQAYDFVHLNRTMGCVLQIGGSDQWANIVAGTELGRKMNAVAGQEREVMYGLTSPLLLNRDGTKMGKTAKGALWVARDKTVPYDFYQYFYNVDDADTGMLLRLFTDIPLAEIEAAVGGDIRAAKRRMALEITALIHGREEAEAAASAASALFAGDGATGDAPELAFAWNGRTVAKLADVLAESGFLPSKAEVRRQIAQGALMVDGVKITDENAELARGGGQAEILVKKNRIAHKMYFYHSQIKKR
ncbi:tyrosine--tRNA ligase [Alphaproteobacteria bacterium]|nr:tyrosine--tRNA ligase [Alphaproteobacteria bacterium]